MSSLPTLSDRSRWFWLSLIIVLLLAMTLGLGYRPAQRWVVNRRAHTLAAEAQRAIDERLWLPSAEKIRTALLLAPANAEVLRVTARFLSLNGQGRALAYWEQLVATGRATSADRQAMVRLALAISRLDIAQTGLNELLSLDANDPVTQELALEQLLALSNWRAAVAGSRIALQTRPTAPEFEGILARSLLASGQPAALAEALPILRRLATNAHPSALEALRALQMIETLPSDELLHAAELLLGNPAASIADKLAAYDTQWRLSPARRAQIQALIPTLLTPENDEDDLVAVVQWLRAHEASDHADLLVPAAASARSEALFLARIELLADQQKWDEAAALINTVSPSITTEVVACALAHLAATRGRSAEVGTHLRTALEAAGSRWSRVKFIATYARQVGQPAIALEAWERLLVDLRYSYAAANQVLASLPDKSFVESERKAYRTLVQLQPNDPELAAQDAYLDLLCNERIDQALLTFQKLFAQHPDSTSLGIGIAFAKFRLGKAEEALTTLENLKIDWAVQEPHRLAIHAAVLAANHQLTDARALAGPIALNQLRPQEQKLIKELQLPR
jgi:hypothetical protein